LEVRGRKSGKRRRLPILRTPYEGSDYLVALAGESEWVRNVRSTDGKAVLRRRGARRVHLIEVPADERPAILAAYIQRGIERSGADSGEKQARYFFGLTSDPSPEELKSIAEYYPCFRIVYSDEVGQAGKRAQATSVSGGSGGVDDPLVRDGGERRHVE